MLSGVASRRGSATNTPGRVLSGTFESPALALVIADRLVGESLTLGVAHAVGRESCGHHVASVAVMSNRMTEMQGDKVAMWAKQLASGKVTLMFDCEPSGIDGAKEALWFFAQRMLDVRLVWTPWMYGGKFAGKQP